MLAPPRCQIWAKSGRGMAAAAVGEIEIEGRDAWEASLFPMGHLQLRRHIMDGEFAFYRWRAPCAPHCCVNRCDSLRYSIIQAVEKRKQQWNRYLKLWLLDRYSTGRYIVLETAYCTVQSSKSRCFYRALGGWFRSKACGPQNDTDCMRVERDFAGLSGSSMEFWCAYWYAPKISVRLFHVLEVA